jgi:ATP/maltotriose-dependent transcriptional regulator MalT
VLLLFNVFPIVWIKVALIPAFKQTRLMDTHRASLERLSKRHHITRREREITELIVQGKCNKEIEGMLFLSSHTVKNHIYRLYQKLGINSRSQLINLILSEAIEV